MHRCWTHFAPLLCSAEHQIPRPKCLLLNKRSKEWLHTFCCRVLGLEEEDFSCEANMVPGVHRFLNLTAASASLQFCCHSMGSCSAEMPAYGRLVSGSQCVQCKLSLSKLSRSSSGVAVLQQTKWRTPSALQLRSASGFQRWGQ